MKSGKYIKDCVLKEVIQLFNFLFLNFLGGRGQ